MNSQAVPPSSCPECGGARVLVCYRQHEIVLGHQTLSRPQGYRFWAVCCTRCGQTIQYADQQFIAQAFEVTRQEHMREQERLAQEAAHEQKRQQKKGLF